MLGLRVPMKSWCHGEGQEQLVLREPEASAACRTQSREVLSPTELEEKRKLPEP